jgi:hypothetical protein
MIISFHPHARERMEERGVKEAEVIATVSEGEQFPVCERRRSDEVNL